MSKLSTPSLAIITLLPLTACTSLNPAPPAPGSPASCSPATLDQFTGQAATSALAARMLAATGKTALRWVQPGMMVTMEFREDRLTVYLDGAKRVERASCS